MIPGTRGRRSGRRRHGSTATKGHSLQRGGMPGLYAGQELSLRQGIDYEVRDVTEDDSAQGELMALGFTAIAVTGIDGKPFLGANFEVLESALEA